jgi:hypothetical protein
LLTVNLACQRELRRSLSDPIRNSSSFSCLSQIRRKVPKTQTALLHGDCAEKPKNFRCDGRRLGFRLDLVEVIWLLLSAAAKFVDLLDEKVERSRPDNKIQSPRSPRSVPIDEGLTRQMS